MKTLITATAISMTLFAASTAAEGLMTKEDATQFCLGQASLANTVMDARQAGVSMANMMTSVRSLEQSDLSLRLIDSVITMAYEEPRYSTAKVKQKVVTEFENKVFLMCLQNVRTAD